MKKNATTGSRIGGFISASDSACICRDGATGQVVVQNCDVVVLRAHLPQPFDVPAV
jgi:hypothetical protein